MFFFVFLLFFFFFGTIEILTLIKLNEKLQIKRHSVYNKRSTAGKWMVHSGYIYL